MVVPGDVLVLLVFNYKKKKTGVESLTKEEVTTELNNLFLLDNTDLSFVSSALMTDLYSVSVCGRKFSVQKHLESFSVAAMHKFVIDNLPGVVKKMRNVNDLKLILPRMHEGSEALSADFLVKTVEFCTQCCQDWKPPLEEKDIFNFAIFSTVDINDCSSHSVIIDFIEEHFVWYRLTKQPFGLTIPERNLVEASPDRKYSLSAAETTEVRTQLRKMVTTNLVKLRLMMPRLEVFNSVLEPRQRLAGDSQTYKRPPLPESVIVIIALLHLADQHGWASAFKIQKFVEVNFPYYRLDLATSFLTKISSWLTNKTNDGHFFNVEKERRGMMAQFQIVPEKLLAAYAWVGRFLRFPGGTVPPDYQGFMRSPRLIREIISLPPSSWRHYFTAQREVRPTTPASGLVTINRNIFTLPPQSDQSAGDQTVLPSTDTGQESEWKKPTMETHLKIALAMIVNKCKILHEQREANGGNPESELHLNMFSFQQNHSLGSIVKIIREVFPYYESTEHTKEFVVEEIKKNKKLLGDYFNLITNEDNMNEYVLKTSALSHIFEDLLSLTDWRLISPSVSSFLQHCELVRAMFGVRPVLSEDTMLALVLFLYGDPGQDFALPLNLIIQIMRSRFGLSYLGYFGSKWSGELIQSSLTELILRLVNLDLDFCQRKAGAELEICLKTEEGRLDEIFANLQESVCSVSAQSRVRGRMKEMMTRFMELVTPPSLPSPATRLELASLPLEPPLPRNYLIALAIKNLTRRPGCPVLMSQVWSYLSSTFPFYQHHQSWTLAELQAGLGWRGTLQFEYKNLAGGDFSIALSQANYVRLQQELAEFSKTNIVEIQKSMRP